MKPNKFDAVLALVGGQVSCSGDEYVYHEAQIPPTEKEIITKLKELEADYNAKQYQRDRAVEYPSINDQLDEIFHKGLTEWKKTIQAVKDKHPKPTEKYGTIKSR